MNAAETIAKAIEKLEGLKGPEPWKLLGGNEWISPIGITVAPDDGGVSPKEAELIVTLHRTIDAQLAILRDAEKDCRTANSEYEERLCRDLWRSELVLATAILGGDL